MTGSFLLNGRWVEFHPALPDEDNANVLYTILFGLQEDKTYPVKVEFKRTNNGTGAVIERQTYHRVYTTRVSPVGYGGNAVFVADGQRFLDGD